MSELIVMLTHNDVTVPDAMETFLACTEEYAEGDSVSCTAYADGTATYYVNGKQVKLTEDELKKLEKDGKVTIKIKNLKEK